MSSTVELTKENFDQTVSGQRVRPDRLLGVLVRPVSAVRARSTRRRRSANDDLVFAKVDTEAQPELAAAFEIQSIPTLMIVRDQVAVFAQPGALPEAALEDVIGQARKLDMDEVRKSIAEQQDAAAVACARRTAGRRARPSAGPLDVASVDGRGSERVAGRVAAHRRPAQLGEGLQVGLAAEAGAGAGRGDAAEGRDRLVVHRLVVDVDDAGGDAVGEFQAARGVPGDDAEGEAVRARRRRAPRPRRGSRRTVRARPGRRPPRRTRGCGRRRRRARSAGRTGRGGCRRPRASRRRAVLDSTSPWILASWARSMIGPRWTCSRCGSPTASESALAASRSTYSS